MVAPTLRASLPSTGDRDVSYLLQNATGLLVLSRVGDVVYLDGNPLMPGEGLTSGGAFIASLPTGFRPTMRRDFQLTTALVSSTFRSAFQFKTGGVGCWSPDTTDRYYLHLSWRTEDAWPSTLPGVPV